MHIWMQHTEHLGKAEIPAEAAGAWALKGWVPCEPPVDADPAMVEHQPRTFTFEIPGPDGAETREALIADAQDRTPPSTENEEH